MEDVKNKSGSVVFNMAMQDELFNLCLEGKSIRKIAKHFEIDMRDLLEMLNTYPKFAKKFALSRSQGLEALADDLLDLADDYDDIQRAKLKADNVKWILGKRLPDAYGDKMKVEVDVVDLKGALDDARHRATLPDSYQGTESISDESTESDSYGDDTTDISSDDEDIFS